VTVGVLTSIVVLAAGLWFGYVLNKRRTDTSLFECGACGHAFEVTPLQALFAMHRFGSKYLRCPSCGSMTWTTPVPRP
jgi:uncharacterized C2H2 Zn-finger protein